MPTPTPTPNLGNAMDALRQRAEYWQISIDDYLDRVRRGVIAYPEDIALYENVYGSPTPTPTPMPTPGLPWELAAQGQINPIPTDRASVPLGAGEGQGSNMEAILAAWNAAIATPTPTATPGPTPTPGFTPWPTATTPPTATPWPTYAPTATQPAATPWPTATQVPTATPWPTFTSTPTATQTSVSQEDLISQLPIIGPGGTPESVYLGTPTPAPTPTPPTPSAVTTQPRTLIPQVAKDMFFGWPTAPAPTPTPGTSYAGERGPIPVKPAPSLPEQYLYQKGVVPTPSTPPYEYPEATGWRSSLGNLIGEVSEYYTAKHLKSQVVRTVRAHSDLWERYNSLPDGYEKQAIANDLRMLEGQYDQFIAASHTGGAAPRALGTLLEYPSLYSDWGGLKAEVGGELGLEFPPLAGRITSPLGDIGTTPDFATNEAAPPITPEFTDLTQYLQPLSAMQTPQTQAGVPGLMQRGGMGMFNPASIANAPAGQLPTENVPEGGGAFSPVSTFDNRGFGSYARLVEGMGDQWNPNSWDPDTGLSRGPTNLMQGGDPRSLRMYLGGMDRTPSRQGLSVERVDLGQGEQDYYVRRDGMGNIRSFTPTSSVSPITKQKTNLKYY